MLASCGAKIMYIPDEIVEKIRQNADIVDIINEYVPLKRAGANHKALSPFNKEKTPSFMVNRQRQSFKCYSSGHGGDVFKFLMLHENIDFPTAVRRLAERLRIDIPEPRGGGGGKQGKGNPADARAQKEMLLKLHEKLALHWRDLLLKSDEAQPARDYLESRQIPLDWAQQFTLGYAPQGWDGTAQWAKKEGFGEKQLIEAGLALKRERGAGVYDRFRHRLMFPIRDEMGRIVGFSGRLLDAEAKEAKYVNSPETVLFKKGKILFGFGCAGGWNRLHRADSMRPSPACWRRE